MNESDNDLGQGIRYHFLNKKLEELRALEKSLPPVKEEAAIVRFWKPLAIAASVLVVISLAFWLNGSDRNDELFAKNFQPYPNVFEPTQRGPESADYRATAFAMYEQENYARAADLFKELLVQKREPEILFLLGNANMALGRFDEAKEDFAVVIANYDGLDDLAKWYLSLCYLKTGDRVEAERIWKEINKYPITNSQ